MKRFSLFRLLQTMVKILSRLSLYNLAKFLTQNVQHTHSLQLAINYAFREETIQQIIEQCRKVINHFKHSNIVKQALENKQEQLGMPRMTLLQSCSAKWNFTFLMLERLYKNRCPISNVLVD